MKNPGAALKENPGLRYAIRAENPAADAADPT
jgi:hypothetical protein